MDRLRLLEETDRWRWPEDARDVVLVGLDETDAGRRRTAVELSASVMSDQVAMRLLKILCTDPDTDVRAAAATSFGPVLEECDACGWNDVFDQPPIGRACFSEIRRVLERTYRDAEAPELARRRALESAVRAPEPWQHGATRAAWLSSDDAWRATAVFCMGYLEGFDAEICDALETHEVLELAVVAAGQSGTETAGGRILALARSCDDPELRLAAVEALGNLRPSGSYELLVELSVSDDEVLSAAAAEALAFRGEGLLDASVDGEYELD